MLDALRDGETLILDQNYFLKPYIISGRMVILKSSGPERVIQLDTGNKLGIPLYGDDSLFTLQAGGKLILDQSVTLQPGFGRVYVNDGGTFTMEGGAISGNTGATGGGVFVSGTFTKTGGTIYGYNAGNSLSNTVKFYDAVLTGQGHAVSSGSYRPYRDTTVAVNQNMNVKDRDYTGQWTD
jgi:hypothetical protein